MSYQQYRPSQFNMMPDAVKNLLIINGLFFIATVVLEKYGLQLEHSLGLHYYKSSLFKPFQLITHLFIHGSMMHIFSNMFSLWMFGTALENYWGPKRFLVYYFATGLGAAIIHTLATGYDIYTIRLAAEAFNQAPDIDSFLYFTKHNVPNAYNTITPFLQLVNEWQNAPGNDPYFISKANTLVGQLIEYKMDIPAVGASGAVFGILLAFGMLFPNTELFLIFFPIPIKAKYFVIGYGLIELYNGFQNNPADNVAHFAHLGGMLFGFILIKYWSKGRQHFY